MVKGVTRTSAQAGPVPPAHSAATGKPPPSAQKAAPPTKASSPVAVSPLITEVRSPTPGGGYVIGGQRPSPPRKP
jgi:hypothetical protein